MSNFFFIIIFFNCILVSILLWLITFVGSYFFTVKNNNLQKTNFECGFFTVNKNILQINLNFFTSAIFLLLYDLEFILLIPFFFNFFLINIYYKLIVFLFLIVLIVTLLFDIESNSINWYFN